MGLFAIHLARRAGAALGVCDRIVNEDEENPLGIFQLVE
jgi:hypothetical protein